MRLYHDCSLSDGIIFDSLLSQNNTEHVDVKKW